MVKKTTRRKPLSLGGPTQHPHFTKAPIVEAVIEVLVTGKTGLEALKSIDKLANLPATRRAFSERQELWAQSMNVTVGPQVSTSARTERSGVLMSAPLDGLTAQFRVDGMAIIKQAPYNRWETFSGAFKKHWRKYVEVLEPSIVRRIGVRYVNRIDLAPSDTSNGQIDLNRFFTLRPEMPSPIQTGIRRFYLEMELPATGYEELSIVVRQGTAPSPFPEHVAIVLDFDVYCEREHPVEWEAMSKTLQSMRDCKNQIFNAALQDDLKKRYS